MSDPKEDIVRLGSRYAEETLRAVERTRQAVSESKATLGDRSLILANLLSQFSTGGMFLGAFGLNIALDPAAQKVARLAGARRHASEIYFRTQRDLFESGEIDKIQAIDPGVSTAISNAFADLNRAVQEALQEENTWGEIPERIADTAMNEIYAGFMRALFDLLAQLLSLLQNIGRAALNLIDAADKASGILEFLTRFALPIAIVLVILWAGPKFGKSPHA